LYSPKDKNLYLMSTICKNKLRYWFY
jgi:hypothetical protein